MYPAATGSRSYEVVCNGEDNAFELFKKTHCSPRNGFTPNVKKAIVSPLEYFSSS